ncbi:MAG: hypothetical protein HC890_18805 [Chloroflexaceae bacterium]|nr:hypothetical protein [Chloroflexaceae bacterium]
MSLIGVLHHEMWNDELQAWLLARDSDSIFDLFANMKDEGHPALWHLVLFGLTRLTQNPIAMQFFHLLIATGVVYVFARFAPFNQLIKCLFTFSYFPFFEYGLISRSYSLGCFINFFI